MAIFRDEYLFNEEVDKLDLANDNSFLEVTDRRSFLVGGAQAVGLIALIVSGSGTATARSESWKEALEKITKGGVPLEGKLVLTMPEIAENGNVVPITLNGEALQNDKVWVRAMHVLATENPWPEVANFNFSELSGKLEVTSRMRLAKSQKVIAIAELSDNRFVVTEAFVKVTIGGCGG